MTTTVIKVGDTEPVEILLLSQSSGQPLTGKTDIKVRIRRHADDTYFDWSDDTFKVAGSVVQSLEVLGEVSAIDSPGVYRLDTANHVKGFDTSQITNPGTDDIYEVTIVQDPGTDAAGVPTGFELKVGFWAEQIDDLTINLPSDIADAVWDSLQQDHEIAGSFGDLMRRVVALQKENYYMDNTNYNSSGLLLSARMRLFETKAGVAAATPGGSGEGEFATYTFTTTPKTGTMYQADIVQTVRDS